MSWARPEDIFSIVHCGLILFAIFLVKIWESDCVAWSIFLHLSDKTGNPIVPSFLFLFKKLLVLFLDGQKIMGILSSFDKFASVVVEGACAQVIVGDLYYDIPLGLYVIRGNNIILGGELDLEGQNLPTDPINVSVAAFRRAQLSRVQLIWSR
ncbi:Glycosyl hydrolases family 28 [Musa troglodytarum]|uniref:Glycosyl hydrolases family 28 n=1 Tax=Musa troglodytarum TaxID=320322 RepID=A0A9E7EHC3_9LILI|nr:Glycosyl hydrolases family 28 [Musa troglodytarum]